MKKTDIHVHCAPARMELSFGNPMDPESHYVCGPAELLETMETHEIGQAILMSGGEAPDNGTFGLGAVNEDCRRISRSYPDRLAWMCNLDPVSPETVLERMGKYKAWGAVGVGEVTFNQWMDHAFLYELFGAAQKLGLPVICHMSPEPGIEYGVCDRAGLPLLEQTLQQFPDLKFLGHSQVFWMEISGDCPQTPPAARKGYGKGLVAPGGTLKRLFSTYPNLYGDLSAFSAYCAITRDSDYGLAFLERFQDQLLFATDMTNQCNVPPLGAFLDARAADGRLGSDAYEKICFGNARRLFGIGQEKGGF